VCNKSNIYQEKFGPKVGQVAQAAQLLHAHSTTTVKWSGKMPMGVSPPEG